VGNDATQRAWSEFLNDERLKKIIEKGKERGLSGWLILVAVKEHKSKDQTSNDFPLDQLCEVFVSQFDAALPVVDTTRAGMAEAPKDSTFNRVFGGILVASWSSPRAYDDSPVFIFLFSFSNMDPQRFKIDLRDELCNKLCWWDIVTRDWVPI